MCISIGYICKARNTRLSLDDIENMVINHLVELGYKKTSILTLDIYYKAETSEVFYIAKTKNKQVLKNDEPLYI